MLTRFWFRTGDSLGYGVTAGSRTEAVQLLAGYGYPRNGEQIVDVIEGVDIQSLDKNHVLPNSGPTVVKGVWFPRHNI